MISPLSVLKTKGKRISDWLYVVAALVAAYVFISHGLSTIFQTAHYLDVTAYVGMNAFWGDIFLKVVGVADIVIGLIILFRPLKLVLIYGSLWVFVPLYLLYVVQGEFEVVAKAMFWVAALFMLWYVHRRKKNFPALR